MAKKQASFEEEEIEIPVFRPERSRKALKSSCIFTLQSSVALWRKAHRCCFFVEWIKNYQQARSSLMWNVGVLIIFSGRSICKRGTQALAILHADYDLVFDVNLMACLHALFWPLKTRGYSWAAPCQSTSLCTTLWTRCGQEVIGRNSETCGRKKQGMVKETGNYTSPSQQSL